VREEAALTGIERLMEVMARLRDPVHGCPWDLEQTFQTLVPFTIEEAYEVAEAVEHGDLDELQNELGDLLFQVVFYARIASEEGHFEFRDVVDGIVEKMVRRHPHVFGEERIATAADQTAAWERHKAAERRSKAEAAGRVASLLDGVSRSLPALTRSRKLQKRAAQAGFDWPSAEAVADKVEEELGEIRAAMVGGAPPERLSEEMGDLLFSCVNLARHLRVEPESALRAGNRKFERRFRRMEALLAELGRPPEDASLQELDALWDKAKAEEGDLGN
jgi:nucleoside triphosphate diphosphatase